MTHNDLPSWLSQNEFPEYIDFEEALEQLSDKHPHWAARRNELAILKLRAKFEALKKLVEIEDEFRALLLKNRLLR